MKLLSALIAVFTVSGAVAQDFDGNDVMTCNGVKGVQGSVNVSCNQGYEPNYSCVSDGTCRDHISNRSQVSQPGHFIFRDPKTGRTEKVKCKNPPKQKLPPKMTMAELKKACRS